MCICQQEIMTVYSIAERLLKLKPMLMRQLTMKEVFKKAICHSATLSLDNPVPDPSLDVQFQPMTMTMKTDVPSSPRSTSSHK